MNERTDRAWLDRVWLLEGLRAHQEIRAALGRRTEALIWFYILRSTGKRLVCKRGRTIQRYAGDLRDYLRFRLRRGRDGLHEELVADRDGGKTGSHRARDRRKPMEKP